MRVILNTEKAGVKDQYIGRRRDSVEGNFEDAGTVICPLTALAQRVA